MHGIDIKSWRRCQSLANIKALDMIRLNARSRVEQEDFTRKPERHWTLAVNLQSETKRFLKKP